MAVRRHIYLPQVTRLIEHRWVAERLVQLPNQPAECYGMGIAGNSDGFCTVCTGQYPAGNFSLLHTAIEAEVKIQVVPHFVQSLRGGKAEGEHRFIAVGVLLVPCRFVCLLLAV